MKDEYCEPVETCGIAEYERKNLDIFDPRTYCFNVGPKKDVCKPKTCPVTNILRKKEVESVEDLPIGKEKKTKLIPLKTPEKTCIAPNAAQVSTRPESERGSDQTGISQQIGARGPSGADGSGSIIGPEGLKIPRSVVGPDGVMGPERVIESGGIMGPGGVVGARGVIGPEAAIGASNSTEPGSARGPGGVHKTTGAYAESLARLAGLDQGPAAFMGTLGDAQTVKESLASMGAISLGGAIVCDCCECDPCVCGPRGLNADNILAAMKTMMESGKELTKLVGALGPGAFTAMETIMVSKGEDAAEWATGGGMTIAEAAELEKQLSAVGIVSREEGLGKIGGVSQTAGMSFADMVAKWGKAGVRGQLSTTEVEKRHKQTSSELAITKAWLRGEFAEMKSCHCLPGMCPCPGDHYVFRGKIGQENAKPDKQQKRTRKKIKKIAKDGKEYEEWNWVTLSATDRESRLSETCICPPTKHYLTPVCSETMVSSKNAEQPKGIYGRDIMVCTCPRLQRTLVILKPEVVKFRDVVLRAFKSYGLDVISERKVQLSPEEASEVYAGYYGHLSFPNLVVSISQAPIIVFSVGGMDAVKKWNNLIGPDGVLPSDWFFPDWIRRKFGCIQEIPEVIYASRNGAVAERENRYFFPNSVIDPVTKNEEDVKDYIGKNVNPTLLKGLAILVKTQPTDPLIFLAEWLMMHNPYQPRFQSSICLSSI